MSTSVAVITGGSAGIGRATAIAFARRGWRVAVLARGEDGLAATRADIERAGGEALTIATDVADPGQVEAAAERIERELGPIDVWINNAMATVFCDFVHTSAADFKRATEVTYLGAVWGTAAALARMKLRNRGTIVQVGSALAYRSIPLQAPYCGAKSALRGFTDSLRCELIHDGSRVHITMVQLAAFNTPQFDWGRTCKQEAPRPVGKIFQPEIAAEAIYWASQRRRREVWVGLPAALAILGTRVLPGWLDRKLARDAYEGQLEPRLTSEPRPDNLLHPVPGDHGAHGRFDDRALAHSAHFWLVQRRWLWVSAAAVTLLALAAALGSAM